MRLLTDQECADELACNDPEVGEALEQWALFVKRNGRTAGMDSQLLDRLEYLLDRISYREAETEDFKDGPGAA